MRHATRWPSRRVHDMRHTAVAFAINLTDAHPKAVQVRFGHSSIQQTYDRYGHLFPQMDVSIADGLDVARQSACSAPVERATVSPLAADRAGGGTSGCPGADPVRTRIGHAGPEKDTNSWPLPVLGGKWRTGRPGP